MKSAKKILQIVGVFLIFSALVTPRLAIALTAGPNNPATAADSNTPSIGSKTWSSTGNIFAKDGAYATVRSTTSSNSHWLVASNFGFSLPSNATVSGIKFEIIDNSDSGGQTDTGARAVKAGTIGTTDRSNLSNCWCDVNTYNEYGSTSDLWGTTWAYSDINNSGFGFAIAADIDRHAEIDVDHVRATITYTTVSTISVSGTVYSDEGSTTLGSKGLAVSVNGAAAAATTTAAANGTYTLSNITANAGDVLTIYLDGNTEKAVTVTVGTGSNMTGINLYQDRLITRCDNSSCSLSNTNLDTADNNGDTDISSIYSVSSSNLTLATDKHLYIPSSHTYAPAGNVSLSGNFTNAGTFTKGTGTVTFTKSSSTQTLNPGSSSFYNVTHSGAGTLQLSTNALTVSNNFTNSAGTYDANGLATTVTATADITGTYTGSTAAQTFSSTLSLTGATLTTTGAGSFVLGSNVTGNASASSSTISGKLDLGGSTRTFTIADGAATDDISISAVVSNGGVTKAGSGKMVLSGANTYTGATTVSAGILNAQNATATGTTAGGISVTSGAAFEIEGTVAIGAEAVTLNGTGISSGGALRSISGTNSLSGAITLGADSRINSDSGTLTLSGGITNAGFLSTIGGSGNVTFTTAAIGGTGGVTKDGSGTLTLSFANTYTGTTTISAGTAVATVNSALGTNAAGTTVASGATLDFQNITYSTTEALTVNGGTVATSTGTSSFAGAITIGATSTISVGGTQLTISGIIGDGTSTYGLTKTGTGKLILTGANSYDGSTTISAGVVNIQNATGLGSATNGTSVTSGAALEVQGGISIGAEALTLNGTGVSSAGAFRNISGTNSLNGTLTLGSNTSIVADAGSITFYGAYTDGGFTLTKGGSGTIIFPNSAWTGTGTTTYNSGSGTFTVPVGTTLTQIEVWGAGGGGGSGDQAPGEAGGGGGGGAYCLKAQSASAGTNISYSVGAGGSGQNARAETAGGDGGSSTVSTYSLTANGGTGGDFGANGGAGGAGGTASGCDTNTSGTNGTAGSSTGNGGAGANGGAGGAGGSPGQAGTAPGGGGGGGNRKHASGAGAAGRITFTYTFSLTTSSISGTVYSDEGSTTLGSKTVAVAINGVSLATTTAAANGTYTIADVAVAANDVLTVYVDGATEKGVAVTKATGSNLTGINIYQDRLITRCDNSCSLTNSNLDTADNYSDTDISSIYSVSGGTLTLASGKHLYIPSSNTFAPGGNVSLSGNWTNAGSFTAGTNTVTFNGSAAQTLTGETFYNLTINNTAASPSDSVDVDSSAAVTVTNTLTVTDGQFQPTTGSDFTNVTISTDGILKPDSSAAVTVSGNWSNSGTFTANSGTVTLDGTSQSVSGATTFYNLSKVEGSNNSTDEVLTFAASTTYTVANTLTLDGRDNDDRINLLSNSGGTKFTLDVTGAAQQVDYLDVTDSQASSNNITCVDCVNGGGNDDGESAPHWIFVSSSSISGTVYSDEGSTTLGSKGLAVSVNGAAASSTTTAAANGTYTLSGIIAAAGDVITVYLDGNTEKAVTVTKATGSNLTGIDLYQNDLITRCDNSSCSLTNSNLDTADTNGDTDISAIYGVSSGTLTLASDKNLYIPSSHTFAPGGDVSLSGNFTNAGTYTAGTETVTFSKGSSTQTLKTGGSSFYAITHSGAGTLQLTTNALTATGAFTNSAGTFDANGQTTTVTGLATVSGGTYSASSVTQTFNGGLTVSGGTLTGSSGAIDVNGDLTFSSGTLTAPSGSFTVSGNWNHTSGTFTPGTNTVTFDGSSGQALTGETFYNLTINNSAASPDDTTDVDSSAAVTVTNTLTVTDGQFQPTTASDFAGVTISTNGILKPDASATITVSGNWSNSGTFTANTGTVTFDGTSQSITGATTFYNFSKTESADNATDEVLTFAASTTYTVTHTLTLDGRDSDDRINLLSNSGGTKFTLDVTGGAQSGDYLDVKDSQASTNNITCANCVNSGGNDDAEAAPHWVFQNTVSVAGTIYSDEGTTALASKALAISVNGTAAAATTTAAGDGTYSFSSVSVASGDVLTIYLDGETEDAVTVTQATGSNMTGINLYQNDLITRCDNSCSLTNTNLDTADNNADADISAIYSVSAGAVTLATDKNLYIPASNTYAPGGDISLSGNFTNAGTFTKGTGTVTFSKSSSTQTFKPGSSSFYNITHSGAGTVQLSTSTLTVTNALTNSAGTFDLAGVSLTATGATISNTATIQLQGGETLTGFTNDTDSGTVTYNGTGTYASGLVAGNSYYNLTFNGTGGSWTLAAALDVNANLTITAGTLDVSTSNYAITVGGTFSNSGTLTARSGTVTLDGGSQTILGSTTFYNFVKSVTSAATLTFEAASTQTINGTLTLQGAVGQLLSLVSSVTSSIWHIDPIGSRVISYLSVKDSTNDNATEIDCTSNCTNAGNNTNWLFGSSDTTAPTVSSFDPADDSTGVSPSSNFVITFSENVSAVSGKNIYFKKSSDDSTVETIAADNYKVTVSGNKVTINPGSDLSDKTSFYVLIDSGAFVDGSSNAYAGISSTTAWSFTTSDITGPTVSSVSPADNSTGVSRTANLVITFDEAVSTVSGKKVTIKKTSDNSIVEAINVVGPNVSGNGTTTVTLNPAAVLDAGTSYYVLIDAGAFTDVSGNEYAGVTSSTAWNFTTASGSSSTPTPSPDPSVTPTPTPTSTPDPGSTPTPTPTPIITPCAYWDILCSTPTPTPDTDPNASPTPTPTQVLGARDDEPPKPTTVGEGIVSLIARVTGKSNADILKFAQEKGPVIATTVVGAGAAATLPVVATNILPQLANVLQFFGAFFSLHRRKSRWGIVVDSDLGRPIAHAVVQVFDAKFHQLKDTQIATADGQFGFLLPPGGYYIVVSQPGFIFPARKKPPTVLHGSEKIYLGEEFESDMKDPDKVPHLVIPMDREDKTPIASMLFSRYFERFLAFVDGLGVVLLLAGGGFNTFFLLTVPGTLNMVFEIIYLLLFLAKFYILVSHQKGLGDVVEAGTKMPLDLAIMRLYDSKTNRIVQTRVTNVHGKFFILVPTGTYTASISKPGYTTVTKENISIAGSTSRALAMHFQLSKDSTGEGDVVPPPREINLPGLRGRRAGGLDRVSTE